MTDLIQRICDAIFRQEGHSTDYTNPGSLRDAPWFAADAAGHRIYPDGSPLTYTSNDPQKRYWIPRTRAEGVAGAAHVVALHIAKGDSLAKLISIYAPPADHNATQVYIKNVSTWASIQDATIPLWMYL